MSILRSPCSRVKWYLSIDITDDMSCRNCISVCVRYYYGPREVNKCDAELYNCLWKGSNDAPGRYRAPDGSTYVYTKIKKGRRHGVAPPDAVMYQWQLHGIDWRRNWDGQKVCSRDHCGSTLSELISKDWFDLLESICMDMEGFAWRIRIRYKALFFLSFFTRLSRTTNDRHAWQGGGRPCMITHFQPNGKVRSFEVHVFGNTHRQESDGDQGERQVVSWFVRSFRTVRLVLEIWCAYVCIALIIRYMRGTLEFEDELFSCPDWNDRCVYDYDMIQICIPCHSLPDPCY